MNSAKYAVSTSSGSANKEEDYYGQYRHRYTIQFPNAIGKVLNYSCFFCLTGDSSAQSNVGGFMGLHDFDSSTGIAHFSSANGIQRIAVTCYAINV